MCEKSKHKTFIKKEKYNAFFLIGIIIVLFSDYIYLILPTLKSGPLVLGSIFSFYGGLGLIFNEFFNTSAK